MEEVEVPDGMEPPAKPYQEDHEDEMHLGMLGQRYYQIQCANDKRITYNFFYFK